MAWFNLINHSSFASFPCSLATNRETISGIPSYPLTKQERLACFLPSRLTNYGTFAANEGRFVCFPSSVVNSLPSFLVYLSSCIAFVS
jgi:hypothetical protein